MTSPIRQVSEVNQEAPTTLFVEDKEFIGTFASADTTPSVLNLKRWKAGNTVAHDITYFDGGFEGKEISILGDGFSTVKYNVSKIKTNQAADKLLSAGRVYRFTQFSSIWVEDEDLLASGTSDPPSGTVVTETAFGQASAVGVANNYSRGDHTHGTMADPVPAHVALADPHTQYQQESEKGAASGYASLDAGSKLPLAQLPAHKVNHEPGGSDAMAVDAAAVTGSLRTIGVGALQAAAGNDARLSDVRTPTAHKVTHQAGGTDEINVAGLTGLLTTAQTPIVHGAVKHDATVEATANKGVAGGYAPLDTDVKVPLVNLHVPVGDKDVGNISLSNTQYLLQYERVTLIGTERLGLTGSTRAIVADIQSKDSVIVGTPRSPQTNFIVPDGYFVDIIGTLTLDKYVRATLQGLGQLILSDDLKTRSRIVLAGRG